MSEILCANINPGGILVRVGGENWSMALHEIILKIITDEVSFHIRIEGTLREVGIRGESSDAYLVIEPEGFPLHRLEDLPSC